MDPRQNEWLKQFWGNFGVKELLKLFLAVTLWVSLIMLSAAFFPNGVCPAIVLFVPFVLPVVVLRWKPAYALYRNVLGNDNFPAEPMPRSTVKVPRQPRPWWSYLPGVWFSLMTLILAYLVIKYLLR